MLVVIFGFSPEVLIAYHTIESAIAVFSRGRDLYVFVQAYQRGATTTQPLLAFVSFYRDDVKAFETAPLIVTEGLDPKTKAVSLRFVEIDKIVAGKTKNIWIFANGAAAAAQLGLLPAKGAEPKGKEPKTPVAKPVAEAKPAAAKPATEVKAPAAKPAAPAAKPATPAPKATPSQ